MKKQWKLTALLCAALILCSCADNENNAGTVTENTLNTAETAEASTSAAEESKRESSAAASGSAEPAEESIASDLPRMDGSTSAVPLEIGLKSGFLDIPYESAKELVSHTTTHDSFKRLINGEVELIFSVPISEEQRKMADEAGVTLFMNPVAREGFVFVVNAENPVDSLTSEQLRKIYSGEIANWSEVGGNDEPILPYQRNTDSGSQNYMTVFMGDTPLLPPKKEYVQGMMMSLMDAIAVYDNSSGAIGYSVFSYAAQMYENGDKVKYIAVDGVKPTKATMADGSYPLLSCTYIIYTDKSPESAKDFTEKVLSEEGQGYVLDSGYLPVNDMEVPEKYLPYEALGTGEQKPDYFTPPREYSDLSLFRTGYQKSADGYFVLTFLNDEELQARINADIRKAMDKLREYYDPMYEDKEEYEDNIDRIRIDLDCRNGYLSIILGYYNHDVFTDPMYGDANIYYHAETLNYDLFSGRKIERFSDLFYECEDFLSDINKSIDNWIGQELLTYSEPVQKLDFSGILGEPRLFTINAVGLEPDNLYFTCAPFLSYSDKNWHSAANRYRDMSGLIAEDYLDILEDRLYDEWEISYVVEDGDTYKRITDSAYHTEEEIKAEDEFWHELQRRTWETFRKTNPDWHTVRHGYQADISTYKRGNYYIVGLRSSCAGEEPNANYDADTLELVTMEMLVGENWRQYLESDIGDYGLIPSEWWADDENVILYAYLDKPAGEDMKHVWGDLGMTMMEVPVSEVNKRYLS